MNTFLNYLLEASIAMSLFYGIYYLLLRKETNFHFIRVYLLASLLGSLLFPFININLAGNSLVPTVGDAIPTYWLPEIVVGGEVVKNELSLTTWQIVTLIYSTGIFLLVIRLFFQLNSLLNYLKKASVRSTEKTYVLEVSDDKPTFSFFNYIIIGQAHLLSEEEKQKIVAHERIHVARYHSLDILFVNMMSILFWFNPIIYFYKKALVQVHEFEADSRAVTNHDVDQYCGLLAKVALHSAEFPIANHFNNSLTLKRIAMLKNMKQAMANWKKMILLPLVALVLLVIACDEQIMNDLQTVSKNATIVTNYPTEVQKAIDEIKSDYPKAEIQVIGVVNDDQATIDKAIESLFGSNQFNTVNIVKFSKDRVTDFDTYVILQKGGTLDQMADITSENGEIFTVVEKTAQPVGGMPALYDLIGKNMQYPVEARRKNVEGKVFVQFIVNEDGSLSDFTVLKGIGEGCDEEAIRVLKLSPNWTPGKQRGVAVKQRMVLPITFGISSKSYNTIEIGRLAESGKDFKVVVNYLEESGSKKITGSIVDENGNPLSGVNLVLEKGTLGTITDANGKFEITPGVTAGRLVVSYVGYNPKYIPF
ncbi:MAG: TonB family protein [Cytophagia bacterium]|nr:TonB family protein [Cytophagia bacterium]